MRHKIHNRIQQAEQTPFDNSSNGYLSDNVQDAIEETQSDAGSARYVISFGYKGNSSPTRYLEIFQNAASNVVPYVVAETANIVALSVSFQSSVTSASFTVYKNGVSAATLVVSSSNRGYTVLSPYITLDPGDYIYAAHSAGNNVSDPIFFVHFKTEA